MKFTDNQLSILSRDERIANEQCFYIPILDTGMVKLVAYKDCLYLDRV